MVFGNQDLGSRLLFAIAKLWGFLGHFTAVRCFQRLDLKRNSYDATESSATWLFKFKFKMKKKLKFSTLVALPTRGSHMGHCEQCLNISIALLVTIKHKAQIHFFATSTYKIKYTIPIKGMCFRG